MLPTTDGNNKEIKQKGFSFLVKKDFTNASQNNNNPSMAGNQHVKISSPEKQEIFGEIANYAFESNNNRKKNNYHNSNDNNDDNSFNEFRLHQQTSSAREGATITSQPSTERQNMLPLHKDPTQEIDQKDQEKNDNMNNLKSEEYLGDVTNIQMNSLSQINIPGGNNLNNKSMSYTRLKPWKERGDFKEGTVAVGSHQHLNMSSQKGQFQEHNPNFLRRSTITGINANNGRHNTIENKFSSGSLGMIKKPKGLSSVLPIIFSGMKTFQTNPTMNPERNLENNIKTMVKFVKLKQKVMEIKRYFLKSKLTKSMVNTQGSLFSRVLDDATSKPIEQEQFSESLWIYSLICNWRFLAKAKDFFKRIPTIEPSSKWKIIWDLLIGIVLIVYFFFIPVHIAINVPIHQMITTQLGYSLHCMMALDILFSMNTGFFEKGVNVQSKTKILLYYVKNYFWGDLISQIPLLVSELGTQDSQLEKIFVMFFFVKIRNFQKIFRKSEESFHLSPRSSNVISLVKLILTILFFSHIFSCIWVFVGKQQDSQSTNWLDKINMNDSDWIQQYIAAYYFSTVTMITVGYGDIVPMNNTERIVSVGTMLISCVIFAYTINQIGTIFSDLLQQDRQMKEFFNIINDYMDNKNIGFSLQYKIREYLDYYWREQDSNKSELEKKVIDSLSDQLREKLMIEANRIVLKDCGIFSNNFNQPVLLKMIPIIQTLHTTPNQTIYSEGQVDEDMFMYFIEKGKVEICREINISDSQKNSKSIVTLGPGESFGAYGFITSMARLEMVRSLEMSNVKHAKVSTILSNIVIIFITNRISMQQSEETTLNTKSKIEISSFDEKVESAQSVNFKITQKSSNKQRLKQHKFFLNQFNYEQCKKWREEQKDVNEQYIASYMSQKIDFLFDGEDGNFQGDDNSMDLQDLENFEDENSESSYVGTSQEEEDDDENEQYSQSSQSYSSDNNNNSYNHKNSHRNRSSRKKHQHKERVFSSNGAIEEEEELENDMTSSNIKLQQLRNRKSTLSKQNKQNEDGSDADKEKSQLLSKSQLSSSNLDSSQSDDTQKNQESSQNIISLLVPSNFDRKITQQQKQSQQISEISGNQNSLNQMDMSKLAITRTSQNVGQSNQQSKNNAIHFDTIHENPSEEGRSFNRGINNKLSTSSPKTPQEGSLELSQRRGGGYRRLTVDTINSNKKMNQKHKKASIIIAGDKNTCEEDSNNNNFNRSQDLSPELIPLRILSNESSSEEKNNYGIDTLKEKQKNTKNSNKNGKNVFGFEDTVVVVDDFNYISSQSIYPPKQAHKSKKKSKNNQQLAQNNTNKQFDSNKITDKNIEFQFIQSSQQKSPLKRGIISSRKEDNQEQNLVSSKTVRIQREASSNQLKRSAESSTEKKRINSPDKKQSDQQVSTIGNEKKVIKQKKSIDIMSFKTNSDPDLQEKTQENSIPPALPKRGFDKRNIKKMKSMIDPPSPQQQQQQDGSSQSPSAERKDGKSPRHNKQKAHERKKAKTLRLIPADGDDEQSTKKFSEKIFKNLLKEENNGKHEDDLNIPERSPGQGSTAKSNQLKKQNETTNTNKQPTLTKKNSSQQRFPHSPELVSMNNADKLANNPTSSVNSITNNEIKKKLPKDRIKDDINSYRRDSADSIPSNSSSHKAQNTMHSKKSGFAKTHREQSLRNVNIGSNNLNSINSKAAHRNSVSSFNTTMNQGLTIHHFKTPLAFNPISGSPMMNPDQNKPIIFEGNEAKNKLNIYQQSQQQQQHDSSNSLSNQQHSRGDQSPSSAISLRKLKHLKTPVQTTSNNNHNNLKQIQLFPHGQIPQVKKERKKRQLSNFVVVQFLLKQSSLTDSYEPPNSYLNMLRKNLLKIEGADINRRPTLKSPNNNPLQQTQSQAPANTPAMMMRNNNNNFLQPRPSLKPSSTEILQIQQQQLLDLLGSQIKAGIHNNNLTNHISKDENQLNNQILDSSVQTQILNLLQNNLNQQQQQLQQNSSIQLQLQQQQGQQLPQQQQTSQQAALQSQQQQILGMNQQPNLTLVNQNIVSQPIPQLNQPQQIFNSIYNNDYQIDEGYSIFQLMNFDEMKNFQYYFPKGNSTIVIHKANAYITNKISQFIKRLKKGKQMLSSKRQTITDSGGFFQRKNSIILKKITRKRSQGHNSGEGQLGSMNSIQLPDDHSIQARKEGRNRNNSLILNNMDENQMSQESENIKVAYSVTEIKAAEAFVGIGGSSIGSRSNNNNIISNNNNSNNNSNHSRNIQNIGVSPIHRKSIFNKFIQNS